MKSKPASSKGSSLADALDSVQFGCPVCALPERDEVDTVWRQRTGGTSMAPKGIKTGIWRWLVDRGHRDLKASAIMNHLRHHVTANG